MKHSYQRLRSIKPSSVTDRDGCCSPSLPHSTGGVEPRPAGSLLSNGGGPTWAVRVVGLQADNSLRQPRPTAQPEDVLAHLLALAGII